tara:strand:+ start:1564 stop:1788 length:225 start_codon:yes stop_codon:yes gene_type:complete
MSWHLLTIRADLEGDPSAILEAVQAALPELTAQLEAVDVDVVEMTDDDIIVRHASGDQAGLYNLVRRAGEGGQS